MSEFDKNVELFEQLAQQIFLEENKKYTAGLLAPRFVEAADRSRHDQTINQVAHVISTMEPSREITATDLRELGDRFYQNGTGYNQEFSDLMDLEQSRDEVSNDSSRIDATGIGRSLEWDGAHTATEDNVYNDENDMSSFVDPTLACTPDEMILVRQASQLIDDELMSTGKVIKASSILKKKSADKFVFQTTIRQASGETEVVIPVEISNETPLFPQVMATTEKVYEISNSGLEELSADGIADENFRRANHVSSLRSAEDYDIALRDDSMGVYAEEVDELEVLAPKMATLGIQEIDDVLRDSVILNESRFSPETRGEGRDLVEQTLADTGMFNSQVKFHGDYDHGLTYHASVNTSKGKLKVIAAVEEKGSILFPPSQFHVEGGEEVYAISRDAFEQATNEGKEVENDLHPFLIAQSYPDLNKQLKGAAVNRKYKLAQQIINTIDEKFGQDWSARATEDYQTWLEESTQSYESRCGDCNYYVEKNITADNDYCNLVKTAAKNVLTDEDAEICTRSTYVDLEDTNVFFDNGESIKINWED